MKPLIYKPVDIFLKNQMTAYVIESKVSVDILSLVYKKNQWRLIFSYFGTQYFVNIEMLDIIRANFWNLALLIRFNKFTNWMKLPILGHFKKEASIESILMNSFRVKESTYLQVPMEGCNAKGCKRLRPFGTRVLFHNVFHNNFTYSHMTMLSGIMKWCYSKWLGGRIFVR